MNKTTNTFLLLIFSIAPIIGQNDYISSQFDAYQKEVFVGSENDTLPYRILFPEGYDKNKDYPLVVFLHGAGERGNDNALQLAWGADLFLEEEFRKKAFEL